MQRANGELNDAEVEHVLPNRRPKKTKRMPGELCDDTTISDADSMRYKCTMSFWIPSSKVFPDVLLDDFKCNGVPAGAACQTAQAR